MRPRIREIDHVVIRVRHMDAALRFYVDGLGCRVERRVEALGLVQLRAGRSLVDLVDVAGTIGRQGGGAPDSGPNMDHFCLRLDRFDAEDLRRHWRALGVECGPVEIRYGAEGAGPSIYLRDPDGNRVELKGPPAREQAQR